MWYLIIALIVWALGIAFVSVLVVADNKRLDRHNTMDDLVEYALPILMITFLTAMIWPLTVLIILLIIVFMLFLKEPFDKLTTWLSEKL